jgi:hypothetical protein
LLQSQSAIDAAFVTAANALLPSYTGLISAAIGNMAVNSSSVLSGSSVGTNATSYSDYLVCLLQRANNAPFAFNIHKYTTPSTDYMAAAVAAMQAKEAAVSGAGGTLLRRRTNEIVKTDSEGVAWRKKKLGSGKAAPFDSQGAGQNLKDSAIRSLLSPLTSESSGVSTPNVSANADEPLAGYINGYPVYSVSAEAHQGAQNSQQSLNYDAALASQRVVGQRGNLLLGGVFLHQLRLRIDDVTITADNKASSCTSTFSKLVTACLPGGLLDSYSFEDDGWFGRDPTYYNRSQLYNANLASENCYHRFVTIAFSYAFPL